MGSTIKLTLKKSFSVSLCLYGEAPSLSARGPARQKPARSAGFTLLELLIVISMMIFITTIAVVNYFGSMRAHSYAAISNNIFNTLLMARQRACLDNKAVYFYLCNSNTFALQESIGTITDVSPSGYIDPNAPSGASVVFYDRYGAPSTWSNATIVNMRNGYTATVWKCSYDLNSCDSSYVYSDGSTTNYIKNLSAWGLHVYLTDSSGWNVTDPYGTALFAPQILPKGFVFVQNAGNSIIFNPDGTVDTSNLQNPPLTVTEQIGVPPKTVTFTIDPKGTIKQGP